MTLNYAEVADVEVAIEDPGARPARGCRTMLAVAFIAVLACVAAAAAFTYTNPVTTRTDKVIELNALNGHVQDTDATQRFNKNFCAGKKPVDSGAPGGEGYFNNVKCMKDGVLNVMEQAGIDVTKGYKGYIDATGRTPITTSYFEAGLCPVNVHWHLGTEHRSVGEFDENGTGPDGHHVVEVLFPRYPLLRHLVAVAPVAPPPSPQVLSAHRRLNDHVRQGFRCHKYNENDAKFTTEYNWQHCKSMKVGETYEIHWPHSAAGACGTPYQYQTPFYDGVFCKDGIISLDPLNTYMKIGVQAQVFTIVNDESYYYPDLMRGMIVDGEYGKDIGKYTGSTTGTSRNNKICSRFTPITWQVDRKCQLISASSFDKMCADMERQGDDLSGDMHPHGARELVADKLAANNLQRRLVDTDSQTEVLERV